MDPILLIVAVVVGFIAGALVSRNNAKDTTAVIAAVNTAKDAVVAHVTSTSQAAPAAVAAAVVAHPIVAAAVIAAPAPTA
jgi:hypothetical protein